MHRELAESSQTASVTTNSIPKSRRTERTALITPLVCPTPAPYDWAVATLIVSCLPRVPWRRAGRTLLGVLALLLWVALAAAQEPPKVVLPVKSKFLVFLLAGQSNMAGRGGVELQDKQPHPRVLALAKEGSWLAAVDPVHYDKSSAGVGPARSFAVVLADADTNANIGLIPAACGGSPISAWEPGAYFDQTASYPYDDAIERAKQAMKDGTLAGILWHQGESDCDASNAPLYQARLEALIARFRKDLAAPDLPIVIGQIGQFSSAPWTQYTRMVHEAHLAVVKKVPHTAFVKSDGLTCKSDNLHFDAKSQREFGARYAAAYLKLQSKP
jgi:hypothetical protein